MMPRIVTTLATFFVLLVTACDGAPGAGSAADADIPGADRYGGTAIVASTADLQSMTALVSSDDRSNQVQRFVLMMPLVRLDEQYQPQPWLAERWDTVRVALDTLELTFHLRRDIHWHDGEPTTAEDVLFTFERAVDPTTGYPNRASFDLWNPRAEVLDPHTIRFRLRPHADFLMIWDALAIVPRHILGDVPPAELTRHPFGTTSPVGNGPFRFVRRIPNQEWVFEANPEFPEALGGRPFLDRLVFRVVPEETTLLTELLTHRVDVYLGPAPALAARIDAGAGVTLLSARYRQYNYIGWNTRLPMFRDARVRRALTMAIDRQQIVDALLYGHGEVGVSTSTPAHWAYDVQEGLKLPYDPDAARALLREAGWQDRNGDGILQDPQGRPFRFTLVTNQGNDLRRDVTEIVQAQLRRIGVIAQPRVLEWNTLIAMLDGTVNERGERERNYEAVVSGWVTAFRKDDAPMLHTRHLDDPFQETGFSNPRVDALIDSLNLIVDREAARPLWREYHELLLQESPYTVLNYPNRLMGHRNRLRGVILDARGDLVTAHRWWIHPRERG